MTGGNPHLRLFPNGDVFWAHRLGQCNHPGFSAVAGWRETGSGYPLLGSPFGTAAQTRARVARARMRSDRRDLVRHSSRTMITRRPVALAAATLCLLAAAGGAAAYEFQYGDYQPCATEDAECSCDGMARWGFEMEENVGTKWVSLRRISRRRRGAWFSSIARAARISEHP
jgi:hypothetical protein